jgi:hypothetical protein
MSEVDIGMNPAYNPASTINFLSNEDTSGFAPRFFIYSGVLRLGCSFPVKKNYFFGIPVDKKIIFCYMYTTISAEKLTFLPASAAAGLSGFRRVP